MEKVLKLLGIGGLILVGGVMALQAFTPTLSSNAAAVPEGDTRIEVMPPIPIDNDYISIDLSGTWSNSCVPMDPQVSVSGNHIQIDTFNPDLICLTVFTDWQETVPVGHLSAGTYEVTVVHHSGTPPLNMDLGNLVFIISRCGDDNDDGVVDVLDVIIELQIIVEAIEPTPRQLFIGDLNRDGNNDILDVLMKLQHIAGLMPTLDECGHPMPANQTDMG